MNPDIAVALVGLTSTLCTLLAGFLGKFYFDKRKENKKKESFAGIASDMHKVYMHLNRVVYKCGSLRAMVMYTENGGGKPTIGGQLFVSIVYEVFSQAGSVRDIFQKVRVDESYVEMLGYMMSNEEKRTIVITERLKNCLLRNIYKEAGTEMAIVYLIKETDKRLYYASFNFPHSELSSELLFHCDLEANGIIQLFKDVK